MDYKKLYTPTEATALYNIAKIKFDPTSYSLRGNLITNASLNDIANQHIAGYNYKAEKYLVDKVITNEKRPYPMELTGMSGEITNSPDPNEWGLLCVQQDNLYVNLETLSRFFELSKIKSTHIMSTIVMVCVALNSEKSCAKDLMCLALTQLCKHTYTNVHNFEWFKDSLNTPGEQMQMLLNKCTIKPVYAPADDCELKVGKHLFTLPDPTVKDTLYSYFINAFEVLWAWDVLPQPYKDCFAQMCWKFEKLGKFDLAMFDGYFKLTPTGFDICPELSDAISIVSPEARYSAYQKLIEDKGKDIYTRCMEFFFKEYPKDHYFNSLFMGFMSFVSQLGMVNIRINTIRILHDYCTAHKYITPTEAKEMDMESKGLMEKFGSGLAAMPTASEERSKALIDFEERTGSYGKASGEDESAHDSSAMFEALDKLKSSFKSGMYSFDTTDVRDTADESRKAYNAIASKVELVNKLLIRRIRDIKTYNVGGKQSGASSGRLDRKAMYRYKYDPNIFYSNNYKTLESDLAFGIILDESGSMSGRGISNGRTTMVVLHETLKALGINHSIIGHTSDGKHHCEISRYQSFREDKTYTTCKNYALIKTEAKCGNCDSGALYYMEKAFERVRNKDKICLIFSDGAPTECTGAELKAQVRHMERKGIKVIGIGINFASIAKYYTEYANGRNLSDMLNIVAKILEEYVLKKKDK